MAKTLRRIGATAARVGALEKMLKRYELAVNSDHKWKPESDRQDAEDRLREVIEELAEIGVKED